MPDPKFKSAPAISRRSVIGAATGARLIQLATAAEGPTDVTVSACRTWLAQTNQIDHLSRKWGRLEHWLAQHRDWYSLTEAAQRDVPEAQALHEIDQKLERLTEKQERSLSRVLSLTASTTEGVLAKLAVAVALIPKEDFPEARQLVAGALVDLTGMTRGVP